MGIGLHCDQFLHVTVVFPSSLWSVCNVSHNGSGLVQLENDITEQVESAQKVASIAEVSASLALNTVRKE